MKKLFLLLITLWAFQANQAQQTLTVSNNTAFAADYTTLGDAVNAANAGDIILVDGTGASYGTDTIDKAVVIIGPGNYFGPPDNQEGYEATTATFDNLYFVDGSAGAYLSGMKVNNSVYVEDNSIMFQRNYINSIVLDSVDNIILHQSYIVSTVSIVQSQNISITNNFIDYLVHNAGSEMSALIENNTISRIYDDLKNSIIRNNIIFYSYSCTVFLPYPSQNNTIDNNIIVCNKNIYNNTNLVNIPFDTLFVGYPTNPDNQYAADARWQLSENSPAKGAADDGGDCGMFGGDEPYVLSGLPSVPIIYDFKTPSGASGDGGLNVEVKVKTNN